MTTQLAPWGTHRVIFDTNDFKVKFICIEKGQRLSLQKHNKRSESWVVVSGNPVVVKGKCKLRLNPEDSIYIPREEIHRIEAPHGNVKLIEIQHGECDEKDIERLADDYNRN